MNSLFAYFNGTPLQMNGLDSSNLQKLRELLNEQASKYPTDKDNIEFIFNQTSEMEKNLREMSKGQLQHFGKKEIAKLAKKWSMTTESFIRMWFMNIQYLILVGKINDDDMFGFLVFDNTSFNALKTVSKEMMQISKSCNLCSAPSKSVCQKCKKIYYCCKEHQVQDWKEHKKVCCK